MEQGQYPHQSMMTREELIKKRDELWKNNSPKEYKKYRYLKAYNELKEV